MEMNKRRKSEYYIEFRIMFVRYLKVATAILKTWKSVYLDIHFFTGILHMKLYMKLAA